MPLQTFPEWLRTAPLYKLVMEQDRLNRIMDLPGAHLWREQHAEHCEQLPQVTAEINRRRGVQERKVA